MKKILLIALLSVFVSFGAVSSFAQTSEYEAQEEMMKNAKKDKETSEEASGDEMSRLEDILDGEAEIDELSKSTSSKKTVRRVHNPRQNVNGIQGRHMPKKVWEPRPAPTGNSLLERLERGQ